MNRIKCNFWQFASLWFETYWKISLWTQRILVQNFTHFSSINKYNRYTRNQPKNVWNLWEKKVQLTIHAGTFKNYVLLWSLWIKVIATSMKYRYLWVPSRNESCFCHQTDSRQWCVWKHFAWNLNDFFVWLIMIRMRL